MPEMYSKILHSVDGVVLDENNQLFFDAAKLVLETNRQIIYLTGKAGTGKTTFLKYIRECFDGNIVVLAPTGVAAINAKGQTIHSFFNLQFTPYIPCDPRLQPNKIYGNLNYHAKKVEVIKQLHLLIIDEISMVRCDILDAIDQILRIYRKSSKPFGGVKLLLVGDTFQLPPIAQYEVWNVLEKFYESPYFFSSKGYRSSDPIYIELEKIYRQQEQEFINILNKIRVNDISFNELNHINARVRSKVADNDKEPPILLAPKNDIVNSHNNIRFSQLNSEIHTFQGIVSNVFPQSMMLAEQILKLRVGAQVMILKNKALDDPGKFEYYNGSIGIITHIDENNQAVSVKLAEKDVPVVITPVIWDNTEFVYNEKTKETTTNVIGTYTQLPLKLAWAISVHKSQGLTFNKVNADLSTCFDFGQVYVALSRCKKLSGLYLVSPIPISAIKTDPRVLAFASTKTPHTIITQEIDRSKADAIYKQIRKAFENNDADEGFELLSQAVKIRDDRETIKFKQYIRIKTKQLLKYKNDSEINKQKIVDLIAESARLIEAHDEIVSAKQQEIDMLIFENKRLGKRLDEIVLKMDKKKDENKNLIEERQQLIRQVESYCKINMKREERMEEIISENEILDKLIQKLHQEMTNCKNEIKRLNSLSWWQRLRGWR